MPSISGGNVPMTLRLSAVVSSWTGTKLPCRNGWCGHSDVPLSGAAKTGPALSPSTHRPPVRAKLLRKSRRFIMAPPCCIASVFVDAYSIYRAPVHRELSQDRIGGAVGRDFRYDESHRRRCVVEFRVTGLDGRVVVITGGARGMGAAYVRGFLAEGAKVVAADLSWDGVEVFRDEVKVAGGLPLLMDVTDNRAVDAAFTAVTERFGTVDVLVNNAGIR